MSQRAYRQSQLTTAKGRTGLLPISPATLWRWVRTGKFPKPYRLSKNITVWDAEQIDDYLRAKMNGQGGADHE